MVEFFVLMAVFVFVIIFFILEHRRREAEDPNSYTNRMKELDALERKHFVKGSLSEEEKARLWDLATTRKERQTADRQMMETIALLAFFKFMSDDR
jgi:uncharacterized membrane protein